MGGSNRANAVYSHYVLEGRGAHLAQYVLPVCAPEVLDLGTVPARVTAATTREESDFRLSKIREGPGTPPLSHDQHNSVTMCAFLPPSRGPFRASCLVAL